MAKYVMRIAARSLRKNGLSIKKIATRMLVSKSTVSIWCRDIQLTAEQMSVLEESKLTGGFKGRLKGAALQKNRRVLEIKNQEKIGIEELGRLKEKELFTAGLGIYLGEGAKDPDTEISLSNSDPKIILFMLNWFCRFCSATRDQFVCHVMINYLHENRVHEVESFWSEITQLPLSQFTKTTLLKVKNKKVYENFKKHFGTIRIKVRRSRRMQRRILGWFKGLLDGGVAQW